MLDRIAAGRTDFVTDYLALGHAAATTDGAGLSLVRHCAYHDDVSAIRFAIAHGETLASLGRNSGSHDAAFHGHWRLCEFLVENGADVRTADTVIGETPLHAAACKANRPAYAAVVTVLLAAGADANAVTKPLEETGAFRRDCRTRGGTPLHRAAAFASENAIRLVLDAGARRDAKDHNGDSPLPGPAGICVMELSIIGHPH